MRVGYIIFALLCIIAFLLFECLTYYAQLSAYQQYALIERQTVVDVVNRAYMLGLEDCQRAILPDSEQVLINVSASGKIWITKP